MFYLLLAVTVATAVGVSFLAVRLMQTAVDRVLARLVEDTEICGAWRQYLRVAIYVAGVTEGASVYQIERLLARQYETTDVIKHMALEIVRSGWDAAIAIVWLLLPVFMLSLVVAEVRLLFGRPDTKAQDPTN